MTPYFCRDASLALAWVFLTVLTAVFAYRGRGWADRFLYGATSLLCGVLAFSFGYSAFLALVHK